jgi:positive regulator of sigma E activity
MIEEQGVVRRSDGSEVAVEITSPGECENCGAHDACRRAGGVLQIRTSTNFDVGSAVRLRVKGVSLLGATAVAYGIPLVSLFLGLVVGYALFLPLGESSAAGLASLIGIACLIVSGFIVKSLDRRLGPKVRYDIESLSAGPAAGRADASAGDIGTKPDDARS